MSDEPDTSTPDLSPVTTDELIAELVSRCDAFAITYLPKANPDGKVKFETRGSWHTTLGMVTALQHDMLHDTTGEPDDDDD